MGTFDDLLTVARFAFKNWSPLSALMSDMKKVSDLVGEADPQLTSRMKANIVALIEASDPVAIAIAVKVFKEQPLTDDERRWMDRASGGPSG